jgi:plasmid stability protein
MAMLQFRELDEDTKRALERRARANRRSTAAEAAAILAEAVGSSNDPRARRALLLREISADGIPWPADLPSPEALLAADRDR